MKHEITRISKIVDELIDFYFLNSSKKVNISIEEKDDSYIIEAESNNILCDEDKIIEFKNIIDTPRQRDMEELYWPLAGTSLDGEEYNLIGIMVDESVIEYDCPRLRIKLIRKK